MFRQKVLNSQCSNHFDSICEKPKDDMFNEVNLIQT